MTGEPLVACTGCGTRLHQACRAELGRCPTLGCAEGGTVVSAPDPRKGAGVAPVVVEVDGGGSPSAARWREPLPWVARRRRRTRRVLAAAVVGLFLLWGWSAALAPGEVARLGGWFSGHGSTLTAVLGTFSPKLHKRRWGNVTVTRAAFSRDGGSLASMGEDGEVLLWDVAGGELRRTIRVPRGSPRYADARQQGLGWTESGDVLVVEDGWLERWSASAAREGPRSRVALDLPEDHRMLAVQPVGESLVRVVAWVAPPSEPGRFREPDGELRVLEVDSASARVLVRTPAPRRTAAVFLDAGGASLLVKRPTGTPERWALEDDEAGPAGRRPWGPRPWPSDDELCAAAGSPGAAFLAWSGPEGLEVLELPRDGAVRLARKVGKDWRTSGWSVQRLTLSADGRRLAVVTIGDLGMWDLAAAEPTRLAAFELRRGEGVGVEGCAFSPDGKLLATWGRDQRVRLWEVP